jgi:hypothetical protein
VSRPVFEHCLFVWKLAASFINIGGNIMSGSLQLVDHSALKTNQLIIILLNILAFVFDLPWLAAFVTLIMLGGAAVGFPGFQFIYRFVLKPVGIMKPVVLFDNPEPHRFAQGLGGIVMLFGSLALFGGPIALGWSLVWVVAGLAALNAFAGFCLGCFFYYWLARLNIPGFHKGPPLGTFPGMRPEESDNRES